MFLMMAMMGGNNPFAGLFGTPATPVVTAPEVVTDEHAVDTALEVVTDDCAAEVVANEYVDRPEAPAEA
jgi:hypothetical protein